MVPIKTIQDLISKHSSLEKELSSGQIEKKQYAEKSKEYSDLNDIIKEAKQYSSFDKEKKDEVGLTQKEIWDKKYRPKNGNF